MSKKIVHIIGTGTIGEPLTGLLCSMKSKLGIDEITFHKRTPLLEDRSKVKALLADGASLAVDDDAREGFIKLGIEPKYESIEAINQASVIIDCTPVGNENKEKIYKSYKGKGKLFIAQGSEYGFGKMYARGINDSVLDHKKDDFLQVVSCNTHNMAAIIHTIGLANGRKLDNLIDGRFLCIRRANDISQDGSFIPSPQVGKHDDAEFGTHHARDAYYLFKTLDLNLNLFSSSMKINSQYMHAIWFNLRLKEPTTKEIILSLIEENPRVAITYKKSANAVFSFGRDHGHFGRILSHMVIAVKTIHIKDGVEVTGFCYTPQDGNSLFSSLAAATWFMYPDSYENRIKCVKQFLFKEV